MTRSVSFLTISRIQSRKAGTGSATTVHSSSGVKVTKRDQTRAAIVLAIRRIEVGRPRVVNADRKLSITAVAEEAGVSDSLIHTRYPDLADRIRKVRGGVVSEQTKKRRDVAKQDRVKIARLRSELKTLQADFARLADRNHVLTIENDYLRSHQKEGKVVPISAGRRGSKR